MVVNHTAQGAVVLFLMIMLLNIRPNVSFHMLVRSIPSRHDISKSSTNVFVSNDRRHQNHRIRGQVRRKLSATNDDKSSDSSNADTGTSTTITTTTTDDPFHVYRNKNNVRDQVFSAISGKGGIKVTAVTARNIMNDLMIQHTMTATSAEALGRTVMCSILMANGIQEEQIVQITINTDGPIRGIVAICSGKGEVRGYVGSPMLGNDMTLEDAVGRKGAVQIVKNHPDWPRPYNGITSVRHGDIDRDIGIYLAESEQRSCALAAATSVTGILCNAAGGYLIEQLPGTSDEEKKIVEENLAKLVELDGGDKLPTNLLLSGRTPLDIATIVLDRLDMVPLQQIEPVLKCECSVDRLVRSLRLLPIADVEDILIKQERVEARCEFCGKEYRLEPDEVRAKLDQGTDEAEKKE